MAVLYWTDKNGKRWRACECLKEWLTAYQNELLRLGIIKRSIDVYQLIGNAADSAGVHRTGGAADIAQRTKAALIVSRNMGAAGWGRDDDPNDGQPDFEPHQHLVLKGCPHNGPARYQIPALEAGFNGLGRNGRGGRDDGPRSGVKWPLRDWKQGIAWAKAQAKPKGGPFTVRLMQINLPGDDEKMADADARLRKAADIINSAKVDVVTLNEMVGRIGAGKPSAAAAKLLQYVGADKWQLVTPTTALNENYILLRRDTTSLAAQAQDFVIRAKVGTRPIGGRHLTRAILQDRATGRMYGLGVTHLVPNDNVGAQAQAVLVAASAKEMSTSNKNCPRIIAGDLNISADPAGFVADGLVNTRKVAKATIVPDTATFTNRNKTRPSLDTDWRIDQVWATPGEVAMYAHLTDTHNGGLFRQPRASDHIPVVVYIRFK